MTGVCAVSGGQELTAAWLTGALAPHLSGGRVTAAVAEPVGTGQVSDTFRLALTYDRDLDLPPTMIAKVPAADQASRNAARTVRTYEIEAGFYGTIAPDLAVSLPTCYFVAYEPEHDDYVVLLEDLAPAVPGDQLAGLDPRQAADAIEELVTLHAAGWDDPALAALPWLNRNSADAAAFSASLLAALYEGFRERYADRLTPEVFKVIEDFLPGLGAYLTPPEGPRTLVHGDFRADNLLFGGARPVVLDWQTCGYGPALADLAYFLGSSLPTPSRREHERALVRQYHSSLTAHGVDMTWAECWDGYRDHAYAGIVMSVGAAMLVERTERGDDMFCTMTARHTQHVLDLRKSADGVG